MPKERKTGREIKKRLFIVCEGKKTEPYYFIDFIEDCNFRGKPIEISVVESGKNTAREIVVFARNLREYREDEVWAVFDKDGYTKHAETFAMAHLSKVKIAFSSIAFEYWILLHFIFSNQVFHNSYQIIDLFHKKEYLNYHKNDKHTYHRIKHLTWNAIENAERIRKLHKELHPTKMIYELNPYTDVDLLIKSIFHLQRIYT